MLAKPYDVTTLAPLLRRLPVWTTAVPTYVIGMLAAFWMFQRLAGL